MYPDQLVSGQLIQIYTVFKTSYTQVQDGMGHFTLFTGHHISLIFIFMFLHYHYQRVKQFGFRSSLTFCRC